MKRFTTLAVASALVASTLVSTSVDARDGRWRGYHRSRVIVEQPAVGLGLGLAGVLMLGQLLNQQPQFQTEQQFEPLPREPKLRRESPIPLK